MFDLLKASKEFGISTPTLLMQTKNDQSNRIDLSGCENALKRFKSTMESQKVNKVTPKTFFPY